MKEPENATANDALIDEAVVRAARAMLEKGHRRLLGIVGAPGSGKSTLAEGLVARLGEQACNVPMDGFHLSNRQLARLGRSERKGAPDTFDTGGYRALLERLRQSNASGGTVFAPDFFRDIEEPIAASIAVADEVPLVITEGNYLLLEEGAWPQVRALLDEVWFLDVETGLREQWLVERHMRFGRSESQAREWVASTDRPNAERVEAVAHRADRRLCWHETGIAFADR
ncbi:nucleoside/nucleotide kinase family protein [Kushneria phosphatilytica]|uniref:Nucleoside/nucleotide kinase family protein n=1 Tax=Kushneria phosphatilytica TaxID=657387 RepID=A0A1S1NRL4_9GAMM|nr:nucleoside/nucleotide kinase family protein [Kushneria phosphatilytica]OHV07704.1 nucleoside/nucleotide kinase family protein [Kushneria phosphatilytica]QEL10200.1 nucleoside/nucleotide kinase family protein [Kushneria phosphatilytica]